MASSLDKMDLLYLWKMCTMAAAGCDSNFLNSNVGGMCVKHQWVINKILIGSASYIHKLYNKLQRVLKLGKSILNNEVLLS